MCIPIEQNIFRRGIRRYLCVCALGIFVSVDVIGKFSKDVFTSVTLIFVRRNYSALLRYLVAWQIIQSMERIFSISHHPYTSCLSRLPYPYHNWPNQLVRHTLAQSYCPFLVTFKCAHSPAITEVKFGRICTHECHPAMVCLSWVIRRKMTPIYRERTVFTRHFCIDRSCIVLLIYKRLKLLIVVTVFL